MGRVLIAGSALLVLAALPAAGVGATDPSQVPSPPQCTLPAYSAPTDALPQLDVANKNGSEEGRTSCIQVKTTIANAMQVGQAGEVSVEVLSDSSVTGKAIVSLELPPSFSVVSMPAGFATAKVSTSKSDGTIGMTLNGNLNLAGGNTANLKFSVKPTAAGAGSIRAIVTDPSHQSIGGEDSVSLTYGTDRASSKFGITIPAVIATARPGSTAKPVQFKPALKARPATLPPQPVPNLPARRAHSAGTTCMRGTFVYQDHNGVVHPADNIAVYANDENVGDDYRLASGVTGTDGSFNLCFNSSGTGPGELNNADPYIQLKTEVAYWKVVKSDGEPYLWHTAVTNNATSGTHDLGTFSTGNANTQRALALYDAINRAYWAIPGCWDEVGTCEQKVANWWPDLNVWPQASRNRFWMPGPGPDYPFVSLHELGHTIMYDAYQHNWPASTCPNPHYGGLGEDEGCAFSEGWASWFAGHVLQDGQFGGWDAPDGNNLLGSFHSDHRLEDQWWHDNWFWGDTVEGRVAGALWDMEDYSSTGLDSYWDRMSGRFNELWHTFQVHDDTDNFREFWAQRGADGYDTTSQNALATLYGDTIDINSFHDTLDPGVNYVRPEPVDGVGGIQDSSPHHNWRTSMTSGRCRIFSLNPSPGSTAILDVYPSPDGTWGSQLNELTVGSSGITTLVLPSRGAVTVYPQVRHFGSITATYKFRTDNCIPLPGRSPFTISAEPTASALEIVPDKARVITVTPTARGSIRATANVKLILQKINGTPNSGTQTLETISTVDVAHSNKAESVTVPASKTANYVVQIITLSGNGAYSIGVKPL